MRYNKVTEMATDDAKPEINEGGSRNGWRRGEQTTDQNVDGCCQAMGKRRQIKKGERARVEYKPDDNGCG